MGQTHARRLVEHRPACPGATHPRPCPGSLAFFRREQQREFARPSLPEAPAHSPHDERMLECLRTRGASFVADLAAETQLTPGDVRASLWNLLRRSGVTNDRFDVIRKG